MQEPKPEQSLPSYIKETSIAPIIRDLRELYNETDLAIESFQKTSHLTCIEGCGSCCERFMPYLESSQALVLALFLIENKPDCINAIINSKTEFCPLYNPHSNYHCTVYEARPLICRMFGFCGVLNKNEEISFSLCFRKKELEVQAESKSQSDSELDSQTQSQTQSQKQSQFTGSEIIAHFSAYPPIMSYFGSKLQNLKADESEELPLPEAIQNAVQKIYLLKQCAQ